jgi:hypothetical protein
MDFVDWLSCSLNIPFPENVLVFVPGTLEVQTTTWVHRRLRDPFETSINREAEKVEQQMSKYAARAIRENTARPECTQTDLISEARRGHTTLSQANLINAQGLEPRFGAKYGREPRTRDPRTRKYTAEINASKVHGMFTEIEKT